ncbi:MAG: hypothetical protein FJX29_06470 [Alphaproteobacteria bacterium]|nr:hypothetical protein [Alphaproteobacteria bacterium]
MQIWGRAHRDYLDMEPLAAPPPRAARWRIGMAHGHYVPQPDRSISPRPAWLFGDSDIEKAACDYIALGHWNRRVQAGPAHQQAHYCGSPDYACSFNLVEMSAAAHIVIRQIPLALSGDVLMKLQQSRP